MSFGLGLCPLGSTPNGLFIPDTIPEKSNLVAQAKVFDPLTKDYLLNSDGSYMSQPGTRQRVLLALSTTQGSSTALSSFGNAIRNVRVLDKTAPRRLENLTRVALQFLENDGSIEIQSVNVSVDGGRVEIDVDFIDLITGEPDTARKTI